MDQYIEELDSTKLNNLTYEENLNKYNIQKQLDTVQNKVEDLINEVKNQDSAYDIDENIDVKKSK